MYQLDSYTGIHLPRRVGVGGGGLWLVSYRWGWFSIFQEKKGSVNILHIKQSAGWYWLPRFIFFFLLTLHLTIPPPSKRTYQSHKYCSPHGRCFRNKLFAAPLVTVVVLYWAEFRIDTPWRNGRRKCSYEHYLQKQKSWRCRKSVSRKYRGLLQEPYQQTVTVILW